MSSSPEDSAPSSIRDNLEQDLRDWWNQRTEDFESNIDDSSGGGSGLWRQMPEIDSKEVARAIPIFENHLGIDFDPSEIRDGGYDSIEGMIDHLVPIMMEKAQLSEE